MCIVTCGYNTNRYSFIRYIGALISFSMYIIQRDCFGTDAWQNGRRTLLVGYTLAPSVSTCRASLVLRTAKRLYFSLLEVNASGLGWSPGVHQLEHAWRETGNSGYSVDARPSLAKSTWTWDACVCLVFRLI